MTVNKLRRRYVAKIWGRSDLPAAFADGLVGSEAIGEICFEVPDRPDAELLIKYLFTSEQLSIQVHPDDAAAHRTGARRGKDEAWYISNAEPGAVIGLGLRHRISREALHRSTLDGSVMTLINWRPVLSGQMYYSPAGTIHAIGAGLTVIEIQQNSDVTYRLYDYGRPRALHVDAAVACASLEAFTPTSDANDVCNARSVWTSGPKFIVERWAYPLSGTLRADRPIWIIPLVDSGFVGREELRAGTVLLVEGVETLALNKHAELLVAYPGCTVADHLIPLSQQDRPHK